MKILVVDSSQSQAVVALLQVKEKQFDLLGATKGSTLVSASESLLPLIHQALADANTDLSEVEVFSVGVGPGSFTGLRIGIATMKALAQVSQKKMIGFSSLRAMWHSLESEATSKAVFVNAYQGQVFAGWYEDEHWKEEALTPDHWLAESLIARMQLPVLLFGSGADAYTSKFETRAHIQLVPQIVLTPVGIARATTELVYSRGSSCLSSYKDIHAKYMRPSQADINLAKRLESQK